jgi:hypothetical protein
LQRVHEVGLVEHGKLGHAVKADLQEEIVHRLHLLFEARVAQVHNVKDQVRVPHLVQGGLDPKYLRGTSRVGFETLSNTPSPLR